MNQVSAKGALRLLLCGFFLVAPLAMSFAKGAEGTMDFASLKGSGVKVLNNYSGLPDEWGVFENYTMRLPEHSHGVYYANPWWPAGGNRLRVTAFEQLADLRSREKGGTFAPKGDTVPTAEGGPFAIYSAEGAPECDGVEFTAAGDGIYKAKLPVGDNRTTLIIHR